MKSITTPPIPPRKTIDWSKDRIASLGTPEVLQLKANAQRLNGSAIIGLCDEVLAERKTAARLAARDARNKKQQLATRQATRQQGAAE